MTVANITQTVFLKNPQVFVNNAKNKSTRQNSTLRILKITQFIMRNVRKLYRKDSRTRFLCVNLVKLSYRGSMLSIKINRIIRNVRRKCWVNDHLCICDLFIIFQNKFIIDIAKNIRVKKLYKTIL